MSKWFEVQVEIWKTVVVEVDDDQCENDAMQIASEECMCGEAGEIRNAFEILPTHLEAAKIHADEVLPL